MTAGVEAGVRNVIGVLEGGKAPDDEAIANGKKPESSGLHLEGPDLSITERILFGAFIFGIIGLFTVIGVLAPGVGWFLYFFLIPFWATFPDRCRRHHRCALPADNLCGRVSHCQAAAREDSLGQKDFKGIQHQGGGFHRRVDVLIGEFRIEFFQQLQLFRGRRFLRRRWRVRKLVSSILVLREQLQT